jgi:hypothetical protein
MRVGSSFWPDLLDWCQWWLGYARGAFCLRERRFGQRKNANRRIRFTFFRSPLALFRTQTPGISRLFADNQPMRPRGLEPPRTN